VDSPIDQQPEVTAAAFVPLEVMATASIPQISKDLENKDKADEKVEEVKD